jgi:cell fate (sporulation/competence/biofilm development) regulator YmcA (YheA/YmcA/DUF963 family)
MRNVMKRAWEIYRTLEGDRLAKLSFALKQAWSEIKGGMKMVELKGSEKQIKWANDLREKMNKEIEMWKKAINQTNYIKETTQQKALDQIEAVKTYINNIENAGDIISEFKDFTKNEFDRASNMIALVRKITGTCSLGRAENMFEVIVFEEEKTQRV